LLPIVTYLFDYITARLVANRRNYIFVDEIQEIDNFKLAIRSLRWTTIMIFTLPATIPKCFRATLPTK
jgi:predicted AAA+ superfamily ATPase